MTTILRNTLGRLATLALGLSLLAPLAQAQTLLIDDFKLPSEPAVSTLSAVGEQTINQFMDTVPGGVRGMYHHNYFNPLGSTSTLRVGGGLAESVVGEGARSEVLFSYGAFTRPTGDPLIGGPLLRLDATPYSGFLLDFTAVSTTLNLIVVAYTSDPLGGGDPLYYSTTALNVDPIVPGGPLSVLLPFRAADPFNFAQVDGLVLLVNRANGATGVAFTLDTFSLATAVPEPSQAAMWLAGVAALAGLARRRRA